MKEFVCCNAGQGIQRVLQTVCIQVDGGGEGMFHAAASRSAGEVINEGIGVERTVVHPTGGGGDNLVQGSNDFCHVVVSGIGIDDYAEMAASLVEIGLARVPDLDRRVNHAVVIRGGELFAGKRC